MTASRETRIGIAMGVAAYTMWGGMPLFIRLLDAVPPPAILSHRILWSFAILVVLAFVLKRWTAAGQAIRRPRIALALGDALVTRVSRGALQLSGCFVK